MKIKFTRDTDPKREGKAFKRGAVVEVSPASARHWFARDAAVEVKPTPEVPNDPVDSPLPDSGDTGNGPKPDAGTGHQY